MIIVGRNLWYLFQKFVIYQLIIIWFIITRSLAPYKTVLRGLSSGSAKDDALEHHGSKSWNKNRRQRSVSWVTIAYKNLPKTLLKSSCFCSLWWCSVLKCIFISLFSDAVVSQVLDELGLGLTDQVR